MRSIVWFRRDLRVHEHPALRAAGAGAIPVFCLDDRLLRGRHASGPRARFLLECLRDLDGALRELGSGLVIRHGPPERELAQLVADTGAGAVHFSADVSPFARRRGRLVADALGDEVELCAHPGLFAHDDPGSITTRDGRPQTVFTHYYNAWRDSPRRAVAGAPRELDALPSKLRKGRLPGAEDFGCGDSVPDPAPGGEGAGRKRMDAWLREGVAEYSDEHDSLGTDRTSRLSPYLRFGCVSAREVESRLGRGKGPQAFRRQLCWRDFYAQHLLHNPGNAKQAYRERYRGLRWSRSERRLEAWQEGRTGYPLVDAGMRQLRAEGFIHNRARLVVGSFLTKDLGIDWRSGERWFMRWLLDGDEANNNGNWQWIAGTGVDPQPVARRIYNPARHQERHDPGNVYVRRWVPELARVPDRYMTEPWMMPPEVQQEAGCVIGADYPEPIVDHAEARRAALDRYGA